MANKKKVEYFDVRIIKTKGGKLKFDDRCYMHRHAVRGRWMTEMVDASERDRKALAEVIRRGQEAAR